MLEKNRKKRLSASELLNHEFLTNSNNNFNNIKENNIYNKFSRSAYTNRAKGFLDIPKIDKLKLTQGKPLSKYADINFNKTSIQPKNLFHTEFRNSVPPKNLFQTDFGDMNQPLLKKYSIGDKIYDNQLNLIVDSCINNFIKYKEGSNIAKFSVEEIKELLDDNWLVLVTDVNWGQFDFNISASQKGNFAVFSLDNKLFIICRY